VIAVVFLIIIAVLAVGFLGSFVLNYIRTSPLDKTQLSLNCIQDVNIQVLDACYNINSELATLNIKVKNKRELILGDFFLILITYQNGETEKIPTPLNTFVKGYETKTIQAFKSEEINLFSEIEKIKVIPQIEGQNYLCDQSAPEVESVKLCGGSEETVNP